jgi:hypothetical protein
MGNGEYLFWDEKDSQIYSLLVSELQRAYSLGYSVVELARTLNHKTANKLYAVMRNAGIVRKMERKRQPKFEVHPALDSALKKCKLSFLQWCCSHGVEPGPTAAALALPADEDDHASLAAHRSFQQDFPTLYAKVYQTVPPETPCRDPEPIKERRSTYSVVIVFDQEKHAYEAHIPEIPECRAEGKNRDEAYFRLKQQYVMRSSIVKLRLLQPKQTPWA